MSAPQNNATIILLHGYGQNRLARRWYAEVLSKAGYGILMYDQRGSGESVGEHRSFGWEDSADVGAAIQLLKDRTGEASTEISILGCSVGGQIALQAAAHYEKLKAVWADGPATIRAKDIPPAKNLDTWIYVISSSITDWILEKHLDIEAPPPMIEIISEIAPRPIMLVGGGIAVSFTGSEAPQVERYASRAGDNAQVWIIPDAYHWDGFVVNSGDYKARLVTFSTPFSTRPNWINYLCRHEWNPLRITAILAWMLKSRVETHSQTGRSGIP